jgi:imidazolonepropionase
MLSNDLLPEVMKEGLAKRVDIYIDEHAFSSQEARVYLEKAKAMGFDITVHGDQFIRGGSTEAVKMQARSVDHLEVSGKEEIDMLAASNVIPVVLPGSSIGLGVAFAPARKLLNAGASLAIGSDWNPGSAPMGDLLMQASVLGMYEKLSFAETMAGISYRAAAALNIHDRGVIKSGKKADIIAFHGNDYREIIYNQGKIKPVKIWKNGSMIQ